MDLVHLLDLSIVKFGLSAQSSVAVEEADPISACTYRETFITQTEVVKRCPTVEIYSRVYCSSEGVFVNAHSV